MTQRFKSTAWVGAGHPRWLADESSRDHLVPGGVKLDTAAFPVEDAVTATVSGAGAAQGATSIPLASPLSGPIPIDTVLDWTGTGELSKLTAGANAGATSLSVVALDAAIEAGDTATYPGLGKKYVPEGTILGMTQAEMDAGAKWGPAADSDAIIRILRFGIEDLLEDDEGVLVRPGSVIKYNLLPQAPLSSARLTQLRDTGYVLQRGVA